MIRHYADDGSPLKLGEAITARLSDAFEAAIRSQDMLDAQLAAYAYAYLCELEKLGEGDHLAARVYGAFRRYADQLPEGGARDFLVHEVQMMNRLRRAR